MRDLTLLSPRGHLVAIAMKPLSGLVVIFWWGLPSITGPSEAHRTKLQDDLNGNLCFMLQTAKNCGKSEREDFGSHNLAVL